MAVWMALCLDTFAVEIKRKKNLTKKVSKNEKIITIYFSRLLEHRCH